MREMALNDIRNRIIERVRLKPDQLLDHPAQAWEHPKEQAAALSGVLRELGQVDTLKAYRSERAGGALVCIDGHLRRSLDTELEWDVDVLDLSDAEADYMLAVFDPVGTLKVADKEKLAALLEVVNSGEAAVQQMLADEATKAGLYLDKPKGEDPGAQVDKAEELRVKWGVSSGQLWLLGEHRLICGDCTDKATVNRVMEGERAAVCLTDPPYGLGSGKESGKNEYDQHEDTRDNLIVLAREWLPIAREISAAVVFSPGVTNAWLYPEADWVMCWFYGGGQLCSSWGFNCWQPFLCYGKDPSLASGHGGRPDAVDMNTPANAGDIDHPCPKPLKLWEWFIERLSFSNSDVFYEPFSGSGTTIIACEKLGRKCRAVEISPAYVAVALERWAQMTGKTPCLSQS